MSKHQYKFNVGMGCGGCASAIREALSALDGLESFNIVVEEQTVYVVTQPSVSYDTVLAVLKDTGKTIRSGEADGVAKEV